jgi:hypothetical protein
LTIVVACSAGLFGAVSTLVIGNRHTRNCESSHGAAYLGPALALLSYFVASWCVHGFDPLQAWILPPAGLIAAARDGRAKLVRVLRDHEDAAQSARPTLVLLAAVIASLIADRFGDDRAPRIAGHLGRRDQPRDPAVDPPGVSIDRGQPQHPGRRARRMLQAAGAVDRVIVAFVLVGMLRRRLRSIARSDADQPMRRPSRRESSTYCCCCWEIGLLPLLTLINGARVTHVLSLSDPSGHAQSATQAASVAGSDAARGARHRRADFGARSPRALRRGHRPRLARALPRRCRKPLPCRARYAAAARSMRP